jgi:hypothetical protein
MTGMFEFVRFESVKFVRQVVRLDCTETSLSLGVIRIEVEHRRHKLETYVTCTLTCTVRRLCQ